MAKVVYIGLKQHKADNVAETGLTWERGQIHEVADEKKAALLLAHKGIWANADEPYKVLEAEDVKPPAPVVTVTVPGARFEIGQPAEVVAGIARGEYVAVFMTPKEKQAFEEFKAVAADEFKAMDSAHEPESKPTLHAKKQGKAQLSAEM